jgi:hypothetical protein
MVGFYSNLAPFLPRTGFTSSFQQEKSIFRHSSLLPVIPAMQYLSFYLDFAWRISWQ